MEPDKRRMERAYDAQAPGYDDAVGRGIRALMRQLLGDLDVGEAPVALDVACGTGISTFALIKKTGGKGEFHGVDISEGMLEVARRSAEARGIKNVRFAKGDAENLDFPDATFDVVISNMSLQFFPDKQRALSEMHRVLKPGGRLAILFGAGPMFQEVWEVLEEGAGFERTHVYARHRLTYSEPEFIINDIPYAGCWKISLPEDVLPEFVDEITEKLTETRTGKGFRATWYVILAYGTKP
jgi:ubiquinone/menaquinone biosynthesis C-methylase UbiE